jgi:hypothetical protein
MTEPNVFTHNISMVVAVGPASVGTENDFHSRLLTFWLPGLPARDEQDGQG